MKIIEKQCPELPPPEPPMNLCFTIDACCCKPVHPLISCAWMRELMCQRDKLMAIFRTLDCDFSNGLTKVEFERVALNYSTGCKGSSAQIDIDEFYERFDINRDGVIDADEFVLGFAAYSLVPSMTIKMRDIFWKYDTRRDGCLGRWDIKKVLSEFGVNFTSADVYQFFVRWDLDKSGTIEYGELIAGYVNMVLEACASASTQQAVQNIFEEEGQCPIHSKKSGAPPPKVVNVKGQEFQGCSGMQQAWNRQDNFLKA